MTTNIIKLSILSVSILLSVNIFAQESMDNRQQQTTGTKPVDEGQRNIPKDDKVKGTTTVTNSYKYKTISLSKIKGSYTITGKNLSHAPFKCYYYNHKNKQLSNIATEKSNDIKFIIKKSLLHIGDSIYITNNLDSKDGLNNKYVIIEIEVFK